MAPRPSRQTVDAILDGRLDTLLAAWRGEGVRVEDIPARLAAVNPLAVVSLRTVTRWLADDRDGEPAA